jgi:Flp pilus assembly pilin Flp
MMKKISDESGQGCVEYVVIMFLVSIFVVFIVAYLSGRFTSITWWHAAIVVGTIATINMLSEIRKRMNS